MPAPAALPFRLPAPRTPRVDVLIIAGEHSGDEHAARMVRDLLARDNTLAVCALGGPKLSEAGAQLLHDMTATSVIGLVEVLKNFSFFKTLFNEILRWVEVHKPRAVCFIDYPGMNLRLANALRKRGLSVKGGGAVRTLYYISPQIWAWKAKRRFAMARDLDAMAVIFPFEPECYADTTLRGKVEFVGHPFVADNHVAPVCHDANAPILLLPGSRKQAVSRIFPAMLAGYEHYVARASSPCGSSGTGVPPVGSGGMGVPPMSSKHGRDARATQPARPPQPRRAIVLYPSDEVRHVLCTFPMSDDIELRRTDAATPVAASAVLTSSGTMSMHCALAGIPGAVVYRMNPISYLLGRLLVKVPYIGIANLLLKEPMYPEHIQGAATPDALATQLHDCLENPARLARTTECAQKLRAILHQPANATAADWLARQLAA